MRYKTFLCAVLILFSVNFHFTDIFAQKNETINTGLLTGLKFRSIGPAYSSGRIADFAVNPENINEYYVAVASGNVWKTTNAGVTWIPIFDNYGSYSTADVEIDPNNPNIVWVGTGEYNSQRSVSYGDGVYVSFDGGKSFKNTGLEKSEHIGRIVIDPRNSHVYVAAQGPLWGPGGERGLYKTTDYGETWKKILSVSENTGITDIVYDPRNPAILYAAAYQRRRRVWTLINGGPESAIYKSTDAGKNWKKLTNGIPNVDLGRIGLAISPAHPDTVYAIIEAAEGKGGFFRSTNQGETWKKMNNYMSRSPQYYNRIIADPKNPDKVFSLDTYTRVTYDGGSNFKRLGNKNRHVDDHALWINPDNTNHYRIGGDGGIYETFDNGKKWQFKDNLPVTQFYRVAVDNSKPFYFVYGGTQDNNSMGGPSRTLNSNGIVNSDWFVTNGGDGFESQIDPENPDIVYAQAQYGWLVRYDKKSGESISIKPQPPEGEAYRWNWNSPLIISPHNHKRLYFAANKLFRSDDRGNSWKVISPDLTRQINRNELKVMGIIQTPETPSKNASTSLFGNITALSESVLQENLIYTGADDGLIQITEDGGKNWQKIDNAGNVPEMTYVSCLAASLHDKNTVFATFDGRKNNDFKPYVLKSTNKGKTWNSITGNLPENLPVFDIVQDHVNPDLLFIGTEFGVYTSINSGQNWIKLTAGIPTISVKDLTIQRRENDLIAATFGRGFYILDNYSPLRYISEEKLSQQQAILFPVKDALQFIEKRGHTYRGQDYYSAPNPPVAATFTYYLKEEYKSLKQKRQEKENEQLKNNTPIDYPDFVQLREEDLENKAFLLFTIINADGKVIRKIIAPVKKGLHRINWDLCYPSLQKIMQPGKLFENPKGGEPVPPGKYTVSMQKFENGNFSPLGESRDFLVKRLNNTTLPASRPDEVADFMINCRQLLNKTEGAIEIQEKLLKETRIMQKAALTTPGNLSELLIKLKQTERKLQALSVQLKGNPSISKRHGNQPPDIRERITSIIWGHYRSSSAITQTMKEQYQIAQKMLAPVYKELIQIKTMEIEQYRKTLEKSDAPYTPGRIPDIK